MNSIFYVIIYLIILSLILFITSKSLSMFGLSDNKFLDLTYAFRFLYRIFYPIAVFAFVYPKIEYRNWGYIEPLTLCNFVFLTLGIAINNMIRWKYKKTPQSRTYMFISSSNLSHQEIKVQVMIQAYIFFTPVVGIIVIIFLIKKYFL